MKKSKDQCFKKEADVFEAIKILFKIIEENLPKNSEDRLFAEKIYQYLISSLREKS